MASAPLRIVGGVAGIMLAFCGIMLLAVAATLALAGPLGLQIASLIVGGVLLLTAGAVVYFTLKPLASSMLEVDQFEEATADALADLPFDTIKSLVEKRPIAAVSIAALAGYSMTKDPHNATKNAERLVMGLF